MAKGKYVEDLLKAFKQNDFNAFKQTAEKIIADEKDMSHYRLANTLESIVNSFPDDITINDNSQMLKSDYFNKFPRDERSGSDLVSIITSNNYLNDVVLSQENTDLINRILSEYLNYKKLKKYNLDAKRRLLFCGPPGCGKTMTAKSIANELDLPLLYIHMDSLVSSYLGDTASNMRKIFKYANRGKWIIFFDEFDTIGKKRDDKNEHGELKRSVNTFLQMVDNFKIKTLLIAATNHQHLLDNAIWRRFDELIYFDKPNEIQIKQLLTNKLRVFRKNINFNSISKEFKGMSHAQIERVCHESMRYCILHDKSVINEEILKTSISQEKRRKKIYDSLNTKE